MIKSAYPFICHGNEDFDPNIARLFFILRSLSKLYSREYPETSIGITVVENVPYLMIYVWSIECPSLVTDSKKARSIAEQIATEYGGSYKEYCDGRKEYCGYIVCFENTNLENIETLLKIKSN